MFEGPNVGGGVFRARADQVRCLRRVGHRRVCAVATGGARSPRLRQLVREEQERAVLGSEGVVSLQNLQRKD